MTIEEWLRHAQSVLTESGCPDPGVDACWMAEDTLNMSRSDLKFESDRAIAPKPLDQLNDMLRRRALGEPLQYILRRADFMGLKFYVDRRVLIPRQDTETLVEAALVALRGVADPEVLDLCAGSGCIGLSLKSLAPSARVTLADISRDALEVARHNARALNIEAEFRHGDLFDAVGQHRFDLIASNPPYIPHRDMAGLQREVRCEPALALDGGADGLDFYRRIAETVWDHLNPGGALYLEVGVDEAGPVEALLRMSPHCAETGRVKDLNGIDRVVRCKAI